MNFGKLAETLGSVNANDEAYKFSNLDLVSGVDKGVWNELINLRLKVDGEYVFWKSRGGTKTAKLVAGNIITAYPFNARVSGVLNQFIALQTSMGNIELWNVDTGIMVNAMSGFPTTEKIQFASRGIYLYAFTYDSGVSKYYNIETDDEFTFLDYKYSYITQVNPFKAPIDKGNLFGFKEGAQILVFPNHADVIGTVVNVATGQIDPAKHDTRTFLYTYNSGTYIVDSNGTEYKESQFITFSQGARPLVFTVGGAGNSFDLHKIYIPITAAGEPSFNSYITTITGIRDSDDSLTSTIVEYKDLADVQRSTRIGGVSSIDAQNMDVILPYTNELKDMVGLPSNKKIENIIDVVPNTEYKDPIIYKQYAIHDILNDGSATIVGKPFQFTVSGSSMLTNGYTSTRLTITQADERVAQRSLLASRWKSSAEGAFIPSSESSPNSPLFIVKSINKDRVFIEDNARDSLLQRFANEIIPQSAGIPDLFGPRQLKSNSIAPFSGSLLMGGYTVSRPIPVPYINPATATVENIYVNITPTTQLPNNMALAFQFEYTDGKRSEIVETENYLQKGSAKEEEPVACNQVKASVSVTVTAGASADGGVTISYDGVSVVVNFTLASHPTTTDVAEQIRQAINADNNIMLTADVPSGSVIKFTEKRFGGEFNGQSISVTDVPGSSGVTFSSMTLVLAGASEPVGTFAKGFIACTSNLLSGGEQAGVEGLIQSDSTSVFIVDGNDSTLDAVIKLKTALEATPAINTDWAFTYTYFIINGNSYPGLTMEARVAGPAWNNKFFDVISDRRIDLYWEQGAPGEGWLDRGNYTAGGSTGCTQSIGYINVLANNIPSGTENHAISIDGITTGTIVIDSIDTVEVIANKYAAGIEAKPELDALWRVSVEYAGGTTWRVNVIYRQYGAAGNAKGISMNSTGVDVVSVATDGGSDGGSVPVNPSEKVNSNRLQVHSLNALVRKVYVLGRTTSDGGVTYDFHLIQELSIADAGAHGMVIDLPNTEAQLDEIELDVFAKPLANEVKESLALDNYVLIGTPYQQFNISAQKEIIDQSKILRVIPLDFDVDKSQMRYKLAVFTDVNIQFGYLTEIPSDYGQFFEGKFEITHNNVVLRNRKGVNLIQNIIPFQDKNGIYFLGSDAQLKKALDINRFKVLKENEVQDTVYNRKENEYWFICRSNDVVVFNANDGGWSMMRLGAEKILYSGTFANNKFYLGMNNELCETDVEDEDRDYVSQPSSNPIDCTATTNHIGSEDVKATLKELQVAGQNINLSLYVDLQKGRKETGGAAWNKTFINDKTVQFTALKMFGNSFQLNVTAPMPRIKLFFQGNKNGFISSVRLKSNLTPNTGKARE